MRRISLLVALLAFSVTLSACDAPLEIIEVEKTVTKTEVIEIEVPVIIQDTVTEIQIIEVPTIIYEVEESRTLFWVGDGTHGIFVVSRGEVSYVIEFTYTDPLIGAPYGTYVQIEKQIDGYTDDWFFSEDITGCTEEELGVLLAFPVEDELDFEGQVQGFADSITWEDMMHMYQSFYDNYYYETPFDGCTADDNTT